MSLGGSGVCIGGFRILRVFKKNVTLAILLVTFFGMASSRDPIPKAIS